MIGSWLYGGISAANSFIDNGLRASAGWLSKPIQGSKVYRAGQHAAETGAAFGQSFRGSFSASLQWLNDSNPNVRYEQYKLKLGGFRGTSRGARAGAVSGRFAGALAAVPAHGVQQGLSKAGSLVGKFMKTKGPRMIATAALSAVAIGMGASVYNSIMHGEGGGSKLQSQMNAMYEQQIYNTSSQAGMGSAMSFAGDRIETSNPNAMGGTFAKASGFSHEELGATGDLVFALNANRRN